MLDNHYVPEGYGIITNFDIFGHTISSYSLFVALGLFAGILWFFLTVPRGEKVNTENSFYIVLGVLIFGFVGSKILVIVENLDVLTKNFSSIKHLLFNGKSIIGGLIGGYFGVRFVKKRLNLERVRTGNKIAPAIALGMAIGRIGCFLAPCCYGKVSEHGLFFPALGEKVIPTQLYEAIILLVLLFLTHKRIVTNVLFLILSVILKIFSKSSTSVIFGTLLIFIFSSQRMAAGIRATTLFLAPATVIVPVNLCPPSIFILGISTSFYIL